MKPPQLADLVRTAGRRGDDLVPRPAQGQEPRRNRFPSRPPISVAAPSPDTAPTAVLSSVSSDAHTWNLVYLQLLLEERGWHVVNLGACTPDDDIIDACLSWCPRLLVISTVNGHGLLDGARLAAALRRRPELGHIPVVIGGKLSVAGRLDEAQAAALAEAGFDAVFDDGGDPRLFTSYIARIHGRVG